MLNFPGQLCKLCIKSMWTKWELVFMQNLHSSLGKMNIFMVGKHDYFYFLGLNLFGKIIKT